ncbi:hypothetical protein CbC4_5086 (plasmid) [Clostridium botulinum BKT015925]|nr:hypothetical protein CbC4_5086 [Clostridium botulinum BKT015925]KEH96091.1 hypothetical protein Y848_p0085 [Clostridium botulinum C/D str. Sp77]
MLVINYGTKSEGSQKYIGINRTMLVINAYESKKDEAKEISINRTMLVINPETIDFICSK